MCIRDRGKDYIIGSCKYRNEKIGVDELDLIRDYASVFGKGNNYHYYILSLIHIYGKLPTVSGSNALVSIDPAE